MKKKVLLMGKSGSGKTSMRSIVFSNYLARDTRRLGSTLDVEHSHVRFLGDLVLNLWDCGGQESYMDTYLSAQRDQIFRNVGVLIYVFDVDSVEPDRDVHYYRECIDAMEANSPEANVFVLVHKMDLVDEKDRKQVYEDKCRELRKKSEPVKICTFATSIWDETLYKAWSAIVHTLIPNVATLERHLSQFARICSATEVVLFERTTFLVISRSGQQFDGIEGAGTEASSTNVASAREDGLAGALSEKRFEKISELIKNFKLSCIKFQQQFQGLEIRAAHYTAFLDVLTSNTYVMVVVADPTVQSSAIKLNVQLGRDHFERLQSVNTGR